MRSATCLQTLHILLSFALKATRKALFPCVINSSTSRIPKYLLHSIAMSLELVLKFFIRTLVTVNSSDLTSVCTLVRRLLLPWGMFTPILVFLRDFCFRVQSPYRTDGRTDRQDQYCDVFITAAQQGPKTFGNYGPSLGTKCRVGCNLQCKFRLEAPTGKSLFVWTATVLSDTVLLGGKQRNVRSKYLILSNGFSTIHTVTTDRRTDGQTTPR